MSDAGSLRTITRLVRLVLGVGVFALLFAPATFAPTDERSTASVSAAVLAPTSPDEAPRLVSLKRVTAKVLVLAFVLAAVFFAATGSRAGLGRIAAPTAAADVRRETDRALRAPRRGPPAPVV